MAKTGSTDVGSLVEMYTLRIAELQLEVEALRDR
jgi:hypothetical protein